MESTRKVVSLIRCCLVICTMFALLFGVLGVASTEAALTCTQDQQGKDDEPGQKDLTQFCLGTTTDLSCSASFDFAIRWNWDDTGLSGGNTGDACALFDTDGDSNANFAICVTISGNPATQASQSPRLYRCNDDRPDRCGGAVLITGNSTCSVGQAPDPFAADPGAHKCTGTNCKSLDAAATCCIDLTDFGDPAAARLLDTCSYPSQQPNSDPSDCIVTNECHNAADCPDAGVCTTATCTDGICRYPIEEGKACDDGNACTLNDQCNAAGVCAGGSETSCGTPDQCHLLGTCDPSTGACSNPPAPNGTSCNDGNACTAPDTCQAGVCTGGTTSAVVCTALDQCHNAGVCVPATGICSNPAKPDNTPCSDGNQCTGPDTCQSGLCVPGAPVVVPG